ncbi:ABC transporter ATP-binding protein [Paenibacillus sambharensis]|uniref:ABC transporter ATP-binding protein n=1 Tax=Paenibacillus sambharensis TaxID=1803190 RepID=A0A2W1KZI2_9BACL|nr:ABC transporter ATP-binding protein [Paenibacillus sambharensis]PZD93078.1 ABC transporter ATP-binding protein [Paenibacillus sambharensis]
MIYINDLKMKYGSKDVLKGVNLTIKNGEFVGLIGRNGSGKSTLVDLICQVKKAEGGSINYDFDKKRMYEHVGVQTQNAEFDTRLKVKDICVLWQHIYPGKCEGVDELLELLDLKEVYHQGTGTLSGGQKQKLNILLALIHNPDLVILDELTTGLDAISRAEVQKFLKMLNRERKKTIFMVSHYMDEVETLCDRVCALKDGVIFANGTPAELMERFECSTMQQFAERCLV